MDPILVAISLIVIRKATETLGETLGESSIKSFYSLWKTIKDRMQESENQAVKRGPLYLAGDGDFIDLSADNIEVIAESIQEEMSDDPEFSRKIEKDTKSLLHEIETENPEILEEIKNKINRFQSDLEAVTQKIDTIYADIPDADFIGRDDTLFSGVQYHFHGNGNRVQINSQKEEVSKAVDKKAAEIEHDGKDEKLITGSVSSVTSAYRKYLDQNKNRFNERNLEETLEDSSGQTTRIQKQIERIRSGLTKLIPIEKRLNKLVELREPKPIFNYNRFFRCIGTYILPRGAVREAFTRIALSFLQFEHNVREHQARSEEKDGVSTKDKTYEIVVDEDLRILEDIEDSLASAREDGHSLRYVKQNLNRLTDKVNVRIAIGNNLFIALLYPASACRDLVSNMVSKIGHRELKDEAEMHFGIINRLVGKLDKITDKLDIENLRDPKEKKKATPTLDADNSARIIKTLVEKLDVDDLRAFSPLFNTLAHDSQKELEKSQQKENPDEKKGEELYILSNEAQAAVGLMAQIEGRRLIVEKIVRSDRGKQGFTILVVILYIGLVILSTIVSYAKFGISSGFVVGDNLDDTRLAFFGIPWPVVLWSLIGSFAAMIYRFNRQPIYDFTDAIKWMLTRPVQGVVLGSAFYLLLASGLFLLTGRTVSGTEEGASKITTEIILILSFLVGFSERFSDSVFNALIERYSAATDKDKSTASDLK